MTGGGGGERGEWGERNKGAEIGDRDGEFAGRELERDKERDEKMKGEYVRKSDWEGGMERASILNFCFLSFHFF